MYLDAQEAVERIFADLEQGIPPPPRRLKMLVANFIAQVLNHRSGLVTQVALEHIRQFDHSLAAHGVTTSILSLIVGVECGMEGADLEHLGTAALLHDAGYVRLPRNLVRRRWDCSDDERRLLEQHVQFGVTLLGEKDQLPDAVIRLIEQHHERGDGSGYPAKVRDEGIRQGAKILGLIDVYDGMVSRRNGRPAMLPHHAIRQLFLAGERGQFDKALVELVIRSIGVYPIGSLVRLNTGEQAVVVGVNPQQRLKPCVKITGGPQGESYTTPVELDLATQPADRHVKSVVRVLDPVQERVSVAMYLDDDAVERAA
jgi:HD-GYP domain-containing protein (c-di-GMP phosphodiesterase class II)